MSTFAIPFEQRVRRSAERPVFFNAKFEKEFIEKIERKVQASTEKENESVNSFGIKASGIKLRETKKYTKKSLILAQDER